MIDCESSLHYIQLLTIAVSKYDKEFMQAELKKFNEGDYTSALANVGACLAYVNLDALFSKEEKEWYMSDVKEWIDASAGIIAIKWLIRMVKYGYNEDKGKYLRCS